MSLKFIERVMTATANQNLDFSLIFSLIILRVPCLFFPALDAFSWRTTIPLVQKLLIH